MPVETHAIEIFIACCTAVRGGEPMTPRSASDKEYFPQDWLSDRFDEIGMSHELQGRNSYPDFWVGSSARQPVEGIEVKSLSCSQDRPARHDFDSNSTIPSGEKQGRNVFLAFFLYTGRGADPRPVHSFSLAHVDLINADHAVADAHTNIAIHQFGSYADGFIRNRKMYVFPHPFTLDIGGLGRCRLILPAEWQIQDPRLAQVGELQRTVADDFVKRYSIELLNQGDAEVERSPYPDAGKVRRFDVFELRG